MKSIIKELIVQKAKEKSAYDNIKEGEWLNVYDASGGNIDDAFQMGVQVGEVDFARLLLSYIKEETEQETKS